MNIGKKSSAKPSPERAFTKATHNDCKTAPQQPKTAPHEPKSASQAKKSFTDNRFVSLGRCRPEIRCDFVFLYKIFFYR